MNITDDFRTFLHVKITAKIVNFSHLFGGVIPCRNDAFTLGKNEHSLDEFSPF